MYPTDLIKPFYYLFFNFITIFLNLFIHRDKTIILFGAWYGTRFSGNSRFLFQYLYEHKEEYGFKKVIWVTRDKFLYRELIDLDYEVYLMHSLKSFYFHLKSGIHVINCNSSTSHSTGVKRMGDIMGVLSFGAEHLFLNHGAGEAKANSFSNYEKLFGFKKILVDIYIFFNSIYIFKHFFLCPGGWDKIYFLAFGNHNIETDRILHPENALKSIIYISTGYPEFCPCLKYTQSEFEILKKIMNKKIILYVPTYRTKNNTQYFNPLNDQRFCLFLKENNYFWIEKLHSGTNYDMSANSYNSEYTLKLNKNFDYNLIMNYVSLLVTDYSSSYMSAIFFNKPIVFFTPDYFEYKKNDLGLTPEFDTRIKLEQASSIDELKKKIKNLLTENCLLQEKFTYIKKSYPANYNYKLICSDLFSIIK